MEDQNNSLPKKVLIVEDEKIIAKAMEIKLQKAGINAQAVFNGLECLEKLQKGSYDLILLDIMMPEMDGWEVLSKIKEQGIEIKVVVTSNLSQEEDKIKAKNMGAIDFLVKSNTTISSIAEVVKSLL